MSSRIFLCLWPLASLLLPAQVTTGSLQGVVKDASGAVMPAVTLELLNTSTNSKQNTQSNNSGIYIFNRPLKFAL